MRRPIFPKLSLSLSLLRPRRIGRLPFLRPAKGRSGGARQSRFPNVLELLGFPFPNPRTDAAFRSTQFRRDRPWSAPRPQAWMLRESHARRGKGRPKSPPTERHIRATLLEVFIQRVRKATYDPIASSN